MANDIESGEIFGSNETKVLLISKDESKYIGKISKTRLYELLANILVQMTEENLTF